MIQAKTIVAALPHVLRETAIPGAGRKFQGKVRDWYVADGKRILVTTDRQSAFDVILGCIPFKGAVLNQTAAFWFGKTRHIVPNHMIDVPDPNVLVARDCEPIPVEMVVRGYISGVTKTSIWYSYQQGERQIYGLTFPDGLRKNQKLPTPVITPTTHGGGKGGHDERLTRKEILARKLVTPALYRQMEEAALALFAYGSRWCKQHGLILVDTKYEFGIHDGKLMLMDEIHTPDSSRFWKADTYEERFRKGLEPENFDKEFLRLWYAERGYRGDGEPPPMPQELVVALAQRYVKVYEMLTGSTFTAFRYPIAERISRAVQTVLPRTGAYAQSGVRYEVMDPVKRLAQKQGKVTAGGLTRFGMAEVPQSRGESAYVWEEKDSYRAMVMEGLGTKNLVADATARITGKSYYDAIARDTVAMIVNDLIVVGASPQVVTAYFAVGKSDWFADEHRSGELIRGWASACKAAGAAWGGGETPTLSGIIDPATIDLAGSAVGIIKPKSRLVLGDRLRPGDVIVAFASSGIHANGLTLARQIADKLPQGFGTKLPDGSLFGEALLAPTRLYAGLVDALFAAGTDIHYMVNITGHGWRKLMRAGQAFTYRIDTLPEPQPVFGFIRQHAGIDDREMYGTFNMGAGFAVYVPEKAVASVLSVARAHRIAAWRVGTVVPGPRQVILSPHGIVFSGSDLRVR